jgi:2-dehydropantoate 2-reductase
MPEARKPRVLVVGCGGIGGIVSTTLNEAVQDSAELVTLTTNAEIAKAIQHNGFRLKDSDAVVRGRVVSALSADEPPFDWVLLATQPPQVEDAAKSAPF